MDANLVDTRTGMVSRKIFSDEEVYRLELERIFGRCWLVLGHDSIIPNPGDYLINFMGEDSVIVCRDPRGRVRAFLNTCRHRGNRVCLYDRGNTRTFTCTYHGWSYSTEGKLVGVPFMEEAYYDTLNKDEWGLKEVPKVATYRGLIFGCGDAGAAPVEEYLGDLRWYLDRVYLAEELQVLPQIHRSLSTTNWKIPADNFAGDHYHNVYTHASSRALGLYGRVFQEEQTPTGRFEVALGAHGLGGLETGLGEVSERDLAQAESMGPHVVEWVKERHARMLERLKDLPRRPKGFSRGNIFPNFSFTGGGGFSAFGAHAFYLWHPRGPLKTEVWHLCAVERDAPREVKEMAVVSSSRTGLAASGFFMQDDAANFERVTASIRTSMARELPMNYAMALKYDGKWPGREQWQVEGLPGEIGPHFAEQNQRRFYAYWARLMSDGGKEDAGSDKAEGAGTRSGSLSLS